MTKWEPPKDNQGYGNFTRWKCPTCEFEHEHAHYMPPNAINRDIAPGKKGRIRITSESLTSEKCTVPEHDEFQDNGLWCPVCGWADDVVVIKKDVPEAKDFQCIVRDCTEPVMFVIMPDMGVCASHKKKYRVFAQAEGWRKVK